MKKETIKNCVNCKYAEFQKNKAGHRIFESPGKCKYPEPIFPNSYIDRMTDKPARKSYIDKWTLPNCPCWEKIKR